ncbi:MAG TPA: peptidoglycan-binding protein, partial [Bryobacteraceae bacterium]|nr:peptidoglycan-binding protein [Bryobacteraceae bacterium]
MKLWSWHLGWKRIWIMGAAALLLAGGCRKQQKEAQPKPLSPESIALHAMADHARLDTMRWPNFADLKKPVEDFYAAHNFEAVWLNGKSPTAQARQMMAAFAACGTDGLDPEDYDNSRWSRRAAATKTKEDRATFDMAMTVAAMRYLNDEHNGRVDPKRFNFGIDINQKRYDLAKFLTQKIITSNNVGAVLVTVPPQSNEYKRTLAAYRHWVDLATQDPGGGLPEVSRQMRPGDVYTGAKRMRELLELDGDLKPDAPVTSATRYDPALAAAVRHFQFHHGLQADGKVGAPTIAAMNVPTAERVHQLAIALERWRWLPELYQNAPIFVNLPEYKLRVYSNEPPPPLNLMPPPVEEAGVVHASEQPVPADMTSDHSTIALEMNVVTGKAGILPPKKKGEQPEDHQPPMRVNLMRYLIFRPY